MYISYEYHLSEKDFLHVCSLGIPFIFVFYVLCPEFHTGFYVLLRYMLYILMGIRSSGVFINIFMKDAFEYP
jgi:hypothetical protein